MFLFADQTLKSSQPNIETKSCHQVYIYAHMYISKQIIRSYSMTYSILWMPLGGGYKQLVLAGGVGRVR